VVTLVDAKHVALHWKDSFECQQQIAFADVIVLNKIDLVSSETLQEISAVIQQMNPYAKLIQTENAQAPLTDVLQIGGFDLERVSIQRPDILEAEDTIGDVHGHHHAEDHVHDEHCKHDHDSQDHDHAHHQQQHTTEPSAVGTLLRHDAYVGSVGMETLDAVDGSRFTQWMRTLLDKHGKDIYRMKGVIHVAGDNERFVFHGVHMLLEGKPDRLWREDEVRKCQIVFIGKNLPKAEIEEGFQACLI
jgi:G3E family GTPase